MGVPAPAVLWLLAPASGGCFGLLLRLSARDRPQLVVFAYHGELPIPRGDPAEARAWDGRATGRGADVERQGGDQDRAHHERVDEHAERDQQAELDVEDHRGDGQHHERPGEHDAGAGDDAARCDERRDDAVPVPALADTCLTRAMRKIA